jgi:hypothetical protein
LSLPAGTVTRPASAHARRGLAGPDNDFVFEEDAMRSKRLTVQQKKEIFLALVAAQDTGLMTVAQSQEHVAQEFDITEAQLRQIIEEGLEKEWPPLNEAVQEVG